MSYCNIGEEQCYKHRSSGHYTITSAPYFSVDIRYSPYEETTLEEARMIKMEPLPLFQWLEHSFVACGLEQYQELPVRSRRKDPDVAVMSRASGLSYQRLDSTTVV